MFEKKNEIFIIGKLIEIRKERGISAKDIAEKLGIPQSTYTSSEKKYSMPLDRLLSVCEIVGVDLREILTQVLEPNKEPSQEQESKENVMLTYTPKDLESLNNSINNRLVSLESNMSESLSLIAKSLQEISEKLKNN